MRSTVCGLLLSALLAIPVAATAQSPVSVSAELPFRTQYLFAGIPFAAEQVQQAQVSVGIGSLTAYGFATYDLDASDITEADLYADYYLQLTPLLGAFLGGALYNFDFGPAGGGWQGTPEVYGGVVLGVLLSPTLYVAHDFDLGDGTHVNFALSHSVPLGASGLSLDVAGSVEYNDEYYTSESGLAYGDVSAAVGIPVGPVTLSPIVILQRRISDDFEFFVPNEEVVGVTASFGF